MAWTDLQWSFRGSAALIASLWFACVVGCGCGLGDVPAGTFSVAFQWSDPAPREPTWVHARVERLDGSARTRVAEAPLAPLAEGSQVAFANVPHGGPYRVVVELKAGASKGARALYFGESDPFTLRPGKHVAVAVALSLTASPTLAGDAALSVIDQNEHGYVREQVVSLALAPRGATRLIVANDFALSKGRSELDLDALPHDDSRYLLKWDLDRGLCERAACPDGTRFVYVQVLNDRGYASEVVSTSVELDRTAPDVAAVRLSPTRARADVEVALMVTPSEPLTEAPVLRALPFDPGFGAFVQTAGGAYEARYRSQEVESPREQYLFAVQLVDRAGNRAERAIEPALWIDSTAPGLVWGADVAPSVVGEGQAYSLVFELDEVSADLPIVRVGGAVVRCMFDGLSMRRVQCGHVATQSEGSGERPISIEVRDVAGNAATLFAGTVLYDTLPRCGDGVPRKNNSELCDEGLLNSNAPDATCRLDCRPRRCGDGIVDPLHGEVCDDGNVDDADGCAGDCRSTEACGNGIVDVRVGEACDDENHLSHDGCSSACEVENLVVDAYRAPTLETNAIAYDTRRDRVIAFDHEARALLVLDELGFRRASPVFGASEAPGKALLVYDAARDRLVLVASAIWEWDGTSLEKRSGLDAIHPKLLPGAAATYVGSAARTLVFGGGPFVAGSGETRALGTNELWAWDGSYWDQLTPDDTDSPSPRAYAAMAYDPRRDRVVLFGGIDQSGALSDTWEWDGTRWWRMEPQGEVPPAKGDRLMVYDPTSARVVLLDNSTSEAILWEWDGERWDKVGIDPLDDAYPEALVFDVYRRRLFAVGSDYAAEWVAGNTAWQSVYQDYPRPDPVLGPAVTYEGENARAVLFGGYVPAERAFTRDSREHYFAQTWRWSGSAWSELPVQGEVPSARAFSAMTYDPVRGVSVLFGGQVGTGQPCQAACAEVKLLGDTWELEGNTWRQVAAEGSGPPASSAGKLFYDQTLRRVTLFVPSEAGDMTVWQWDGGAWTELVLTGDVPPSREDFDVAYDPVLKRAVMFGGRSLNQDGSEVLLHDTWEWDGTRFHAKPNALSPSPRSGHAMTFHQTRGAVILTGGARPEGSAADVWEWNGESWRQLATDLVAIEAHRLFFDPKSHAAVAIGGATIVNGARTASEYARIWRFDTESRQCAASLKGCGGASIPRDESCHGDDDVDGDGLMGCADPDCYARCSPSCNPVVMDCDVGLPHCGDAVCSGAENCGLCPEDCGACESLCGDLTCAPDEHAVSCPGDCSR